MTLKNLRSVLDAAGYTESTVADVLHVGALYRRHRHPATAFGRLG